MDMKLKEHNVTLRRGRIVLRPMTEDDWNILLKWNSDLEVLFFSDGGELHSHSLEEIQNIYRAVSQNAYCFITEIEAGPIGECWLQEMNLKRILAKYPERDCRRIDLMIGEKNLWGQGIGTEVIGLLTKFGFEVEKSEYIFGCDIADYNPRSLRAFEKNGYHIDAKIKQSPGERAEFGCDLILSRDLYQESSQFKEVH